MALPRLKLVPRGDVFVQSITRDQNTFEIHFSNGSCCVIEPDREEGTRGLYPFSEELLRRPGGDWLSYNDEVIVVAHSLVFGVVSRRDGPAGVSTILAAYEGYRS